MKITYQLRWRRRSVASRIQGLLLTSIFRCPFERKLLLTSSILNNGFRVSRDYVLEKIGQTCDKSYHVRKLTYRGFPHGSQTELVDVVQVHVKYTRAHPGTAATDRGLI